MANVLIGCWLPHGIVLRHPLKQGVTATLLGLNSSKIIGATFITTEVDSEFWAAWKLANPAFSPYTSNAIFEAKSESHAAGMAKEFKDEKTGFEKLDREAFNVQPAGK